jgi:anti-anti-sigma factor
VSDASQEPQASALIAPAGRLDASAVPALERKLSAALGAGFRHLTVDLSQVTYISSSVLRCLLLAHRQADQQESYLELVQVHPRLMDTFELCGFDRILHCSPPSLPSVV